MQESDNVKEPFADSSFTGLNVADIYIQRERYVTDGSGCSNSLGQHKKSSVGDFCQKQYLILFLPLLLKK